MRKKKEMVYASDAIKRRRKAVETTATFGLLVIAACLCAPLASAGSHMVMEICKWAYAAGAVIFTVARIADVRDSSESMRLRRLRRMETWAGFAFVIASFFWFYNDSRLGAYAGVNALLRDTILFSLVGAMIQLVASWMIASRSRKESADSTGQAKK